MASKKGFTLLELVIVIIILGVLATLGIAQYTRMVERSRGAEARNVLGLIRTQALGYYMQTYNLTGFDNNTAGVGSNPDQIPGNVVGNCRGTNFFWYSISSSTPTGFTAVGTRCTSGGKRPDANTAGTLILSVTGLDTSVNDTWSGTGGY